VNAETSNLDIFDFSGGERFHTMVLPYLSNALRTGIVFDDGDRFTFEAVPRWLADVKQYASPDVTVLLIGNKADLTSNRPVSRAEAEAFAAQAGIGYIEVSAQSNENIDEAFVKLVTGKFG
jgi:GTPase SAR1 family protein